MLLQLQIAAISRQVQKTILPTVKLLCFSLYTCRYFSPPCVYDVDHSDDATDQQDAGKYCENNDRVRRTVIRCCR